MMNKEYLIVDKEDIVHKIEAKTVTDALCQYLIFIGCCISDREMRETVVRNASEIKLAVEFCNSIIWPSSDKIKNIYSNFQTLY